MPIPMEDELITTFCIVDSQINAMFPKRIHAVTFGRFHSKTEAIPLEL